MREPPLTVTTDSGRIDVETVHRWLSGSYWAANRTLDEQRRAMASSVNFGAFAGDRLIGFARVVTDGTTFAWLCDVIVDPEERGKGVGRALMDGVFAHPDLVGIRMTVLATRDAHELYRPYGFDEVEHRNVMARRIPEG
ncbi:MAG: GNAT family N-acetyltransferase [Armatimonadetes bacterium]|nr:GNAT family N-acetyltransferase [Armatimonadota bacterium]